MTRKNETAMNFCTQCGVSQPESSNFCGNCGTSLAFGGPGVPANSPYSRSALNIDPEVSAEYFVAHIEDVLKQEAEQIENLKELYPRNWVAIFASTGRNLPVLSPDADVLAIVRSDAQSLKKLDLEIVIEVHNYAVLALRYRCNEDCKRLERVKVREGLTIPRDWQTHYENLLASGSPILLLAVLQHVFTGNPLAGELYEWENQKTGFFGGDRSRTRNTIVGASVIGAAAALLFGG